MGHTFSLKWPRWLPGVHISSKVDDLLMIFRLFLADFVMLWGHVFNVLFDDVCVVYQPAKQGKQSKAGKATKAKARKARKASKASKARKAKQSKQSEQSKSKESK